VRIRMRHSGSEGPTRTYRIASIEAPTLLLLGYNEPISPVDVGEGLLSLLPNANLLFAAEITVSLKPMLRLLPILSSDILRRLLETGVPKQTSEFPATCTFGCGVHAPCLAHRNQPYRGMTVASAAKTLRRR